MLDLIQPDWSAPANVHAFVTTRRGGVSLAPWDSFNLAAHVDDNPEHVAANRRCLEAYLPKPPVWLDQVHGNRCIDPALTPPHPSADAGCTRFPNTVCAVLTADCLPVLLCDAAGTVVAAAHAGWRGLAAGVIESTVAAMRCDPGEILAWLGPAIGPARFEVGDEVQAEFCQADANAASAFVAHRPGKWWCDLYALARQRLAACGVCRVTGAGYCTVRDHAKFYSYRRDGRTGRMASLIWRT